MDPAATIRAPVPGSGVLGAADEPPLPPTPAQPPTTTVTPPAPNVGDDNNNDSSDDDPASSRHPAGTDLEERICGWLWKKSQHRLMSKWQKRWFVLYAPESIASRDVPRLRYFIKSDTPQLWRCDVLVENASLEWLSDPSAAAPAPPQASTSSQEVLFWSFRLTTPKKIFTLRTAEASVAKAWVMELDRIVGPARPIPAPAREEAPRVAVQQQQQQQQQPVKYVHPRAAALANWGGKKSLTAMGMSGNKVKVGTVKKRNDAGGAPSRSESRRASESSVEEEGDEVTDNHEWVFFEMALCRACGTQGRRWCAKCDDCWVCFQAEPVACPGRPDEAPMFSSALNGRPPPPPLSGVVVGETSRAEAAGVGLRSPGESKWTPVEAVPVGFGMESPSSRFSSSSDDEK